MSKVAIITGSSGGIGAALVRTYIDDGFFVIGLDRNLSNITAISHYTSSFAELDVNLHTFAKENSYRENILQKIRDFFPGKLQKLVIVNNAAEQILKAVSEISWQDWEASFAVNTAAPFFLTQGLVEELEVTSGHVVNVSSIHAKQTKANFTCYAASKSAIEALTRSLALELSQKGISINAVAPAAIATDMLKAGFIDAPEKLHELSSYHPSKSIGTPQEVASFIKAITDHEGGFLTGAVLDIDGGISARLYDPS